MEQPYCMHCEACTCQATAPAERHQCGIALPAADGSYTVEDEYGVDITSANPAACPGPPEDTPPTVTGFAVDQASNTAKLSWAPPALDNFVYGYRCGTHGACRAAACFGDSGRLCGPCEMDGDSGHYMAGASQHANASSKAKWGPRCRAYAGIESGGSGMVPVIERTSGHPHTRAGSSLALAWLCWPQDQLVPLGPDSR
jgi:hypothetical protein